MDRDDRVKMNQDRGGWRRYLLSWIRMSIELDGYLGWDVDADGFPWYVHLEHVRDKERDVESTTIRNAFDDISAGLFGSRDFTSSGLPFVDSQDLYWSGWWFQFKEDAVLFQKTYGGYGTWQDEFKEWSKGCYNRRFPGEAGNNS